MKAITDGLTIKANINSNTGAYTPPRDDAHLVLAAGAAKYRISRQQAAMLYSTIGSFILQVDKAQVRWKAKQEQNRAVRKKRLQRLRGRTRK